MKLLPALLMAAGAILLIPLASATPTLQTFGVSGVTGVFNCPWNAARTQCGWSEFTPYTGATVHTPTSVTSLASDARGTARVSGEISTTSYLPTLHAYAYSNPSATGTPGKPYGGSSIADANIWSVQGDTYTGATDFLLTVTATLDSVFSRPDQDAQGNHSGFRVSIFDSEGYAFNYSGVDNSFGTELCPILAAQPRPRECARMPTVYDAKNAILTDTGTVTSTLSYLLTPGKKFYVGAFLDASACCGVTVDSSHTLNMQFNDASQLDNFVIPGALVAVPEPASLPVMLLGLGLLAGLRRRTTNAG